MGDRAQRPGQPAGLAQGLICRRERPDPGAQLSFTDLDGHRFQCFITDQDDQDIAALEALHRQHAQVEDRVKTLEATGASYLPFHSFATNAALLELALCAHDGMTWTQLLCLDGEHQLCEPKRLRYPNADVGMATGSCTSPGSSPATPVAIPSTSPPTGPWASAILRAFERLQALPVSG